MSLESYLSSLDSTGVENATTMRSVIEFPYEGQVYSIATEGYGTEDAAIDAFLSGQNEPVSYDPLEEGAPEEFDIALDPAQPEASAEWGFTFPERIAPEVVEEPEKGGLFSADWREIGGGIVDSVQGAGQSFAAGTVDFLDDIVKEPLRGLGVPDEMLLPTNEAGEKVDPIGDTVASLRSSAKTNFEGAQASAPDNVVGEFAYNAANATIQMIPDVSLSLALKKPTAGLISMGSRVFGLSYDKAQTDGLSQEESVNHAVRQVLYEVGPEKAFRFFDMVPGAKSAKLWAATSMAEGLSEAVTSALNQGDELTFQDKEWEGWVPFLKRIGYDAALGVVMGGALSAPTALGSSREPTPQQKAKAISIALDAWVSDTELNTEESLQSSAVTSLDPQYNDPAVIDPITGLDSDISPQDISTQSDLPDVVPVDVPDVGQVVAPVAANDPNQIAPPVEQEVLEDLVGADPIQQEVEDLVGGTREALIKDNTKQQLQLLVEKRTGSRPPASQTKAQLVESVFEEAQVLLNTTRGGDLSNPDTFSPEVVDTAEQIPDIDPTVSSQEGIGDSDTDTLSPKSGTPAARKSKIAALKDLDKRARVYSDKGGLTQEEAEEFKSLTERTIKLRYDLTTPSTVEMVTVGSDVNALSKGTIVQAHSDLFLDEGINKVLMEATRGVAHGADTGVDTVMVGANKDISPQELYYAFTPTRESIRAQYGDTVTLYRAETNLQKKKATQNWATTKKFASNFKGTVVEQEFNVDDIIAVVVTKNGAYHEVVIGEKPTKDPADTTDQLATISDTVRTQGKATGELTPNIVNLTRRMQKMSPSLTTPMGTFGEVKPSPAMRKATKMVKSVFGRDVVFFNQDDNYGPKLGGVVLGNDNNTLFVKAYVGDAFMSVLGHELTHSLRRGDEALYQKLAGAARSYYKTDGLNEYGVERGGVDLRNAPGKKSLSLDGVEEELMADIVGTAVSDPAFMRELARRDMGLARRVLDTVIHNLKSIMGKVKKASPDIKGINRYINDTEKLLTEMQSILREELNTNGQPARGPASPRPDELEVLSPEIGDGPTTPVQVQVPAEARPDRPNEILPGGGGRSRGGVDPVGRTEALAETARTASIAGDPINIVHRADGSFSVDGRSYKNKSRDHMKRLADLPESVRAFMDLALITTTTGPRAVEEIYRRLNAHSRALSSDVSSLVKRMDSDYALTSGGKKLKDATHAENRMFSQYMNGLVDSSTVRAETGVSKDFMRTLQNARASISELSGVFINENIIPSEMRATFVDNAGLYLHTTYAINRMNNPGTDLSNLLEKIPAEFRNQYVDAFKMAYHTPITDGTLTDLTLPQLRRMATSLGLTSRTVATTVNKKTEQETQEDVIRLAGTETPIERVTKAQLLGVLAQYPVPQTVADSVIMNALRTEGVSRGDRTTANKGILRRKELSRTAKQLEDAGYSQAEIAMKMATREVMMEAVDPVTTVGTTMLKMMDTIKGHRFINAIAELRYAGLVSIGPSNSERGLTAQLIPSDHPLASVRVPLPERGAEDFTLAGPTSETKTDGLFVHPEVATILHTVLGIGPLPSVPSGLRTIAALGKMNLTAGSPATHIRNIKTSGLISLSHGHVINDPKMFLDAGKLALGISARDLFPANKLRSSDKSRGKQDDLDMIGRYMAQLGLLHDSIGVGAIMDLAVSNLQDKNAKNNLDGNTFVDINGRTLEQVVDAATRRGSPPEYTDATSMSVARRAGKAVTTPIGATADGARTVGTKFLVAYRLEDEAMKVRAFLIERERQAWLLGEDDLVKALKGESKPSPEMQDRIREHDKKVADYITSVYPTYSRVFRWGRALSRALTVSDFPSFNLEMFRNEFHDLEDMMNLARGTGRHEGTKPERRAISLASRAVQKTLAATFNTWSMAAMGITAASLLRGDSDDEDSPAFNPMGTKVTPAQRKRAERAVTYAEFGGVFSRHDLEPLVRNVAPPYYKHSLLGIHDFVPGEYVELEILDYNVIGSQFFKLGNNAGASTEMLIAKGDYKGATESMYEAAYAVVSDYAGPSVAAQMALDLSDGVTSSGREIYNTDDDTVGEAIAKGGKHYTQTMIPGGAIWREVERFVEAASEDRLTDKVESFVKAKSTRIIQFHTSLTMGLRSLEEGPDGMRAPTKKIKGMLTSAEDISEEDFMEAYTDAAERRRDGFTRERNLILNIKALGMSEDKMQRALELRRQSTIAGHSLYDFIDDNYKPFDITAEATPGSSTEDQLLEAAQVRRSGSKSLEEVEDAKKARVSTILQRIEWAQQAEFNLDRRSYDGN